MQQDFDAELSRLEGVNTPDVRGVKNLWAEFSANEALFTDEQRGRLFMLAFEAQRATYEAAIFSIAFESEHTRPTRYPLDQTPLASFTGMAICMGLFQQSLSLWHLSRGVVEESLERRLGDDVEDPIEDPEERAIAQLELGVYALERGDFKRASELAEVARTALGESDHRILLTCADLCCVEANLGLGNLEVVNQVGSNLLSRLPARKHPQLSAIRLGIVLTTIRAASLVDDDDAVKKLIPLAYALLLERNYPAAQKAWVSAGLARAIQLADPQGENATLGQVRQALHESRKREIRTLHANPELQALYLAEESILKFQLKIPVDPLKLDQTAREISKVINQCVKAQEQLTPSLVEAALQVSESAHQCGFRDAISILPVTFQAVEPQNLMVRARVFRRLVALLKPEDFGGPHMTPNNAGRNFLRYVEQLRNECVRRARVSDPISTLERSNIQNGFERLAEVFRQGGAKHPVLHTFADAVLRSLSEI